MILRSGKYSRFWGCSKYPRCGGTRNYKRNAKIISQKNKQLIEMMSREKNILPSIRQRLIGSNDIWIVGIFTSIMGSVLQENL